MHSSAAFAASRSRKGRGRDPIRENSRLGKQSSQEPGRRDATVIQWKERRSVCSAGLWQEKGGRPLGFSLLDRSRIRRCFPRPPKAAAGGFRLARYTEPGRWSVFQSFTGRRGHPRQHRQAIPMAGPGPRSRHGGFRTAGRRSQTFRRGNCLREASSGLGSQGLFHSREAGKSPDSRRYREARRRQYRWNRRP